VRLVAHWRCILRMAVLAQQCCTPRMHGAAGQGYQCTLWRGHRKHADRRRGSHLRPLPGVVHPPVAMRRSPVASQTPFAGAKRDTFLNGECAHVRVATQQRCASWHLRAAHGACCLLLRHSFKDALGLSDEDAAPVHLDVGRRFVRSSFESGSREATAVEKKVPGRAPHGPMQLSRTCGHHLLGSCKHG
jgi:Chloroplast envelope transporter